jgi:inhibitor of KinA
MKFYFHPLGDEACSVVFGDRIDKEVNESVLHLFNHFKRESFVTDVVPAYASLTVFYDPVEVLSRVDSNETSYEFVCNYLIEQIKALPEKEKKIPRQLEVPVCYTGDYSPDLEALSIKLQLLSSEIISIHAGTGYRVYMIGFQPGFAYMGTIDERIAFPRKEKPARRVPAGSVGIAGKQTGIYPFDSPGGWWIIGRTPLTIFDNKATTPVLFQPGDMVTFYPITENEFASYKSRNP